MSTKWRYARRRVATAIARRHGSAGGEDPGLTDEAGFTLIELMVVLVIMGILMAIAIPTFLGVTSTANDTSTQSNLANVTTAAKAIWAKADGYPITATMKTDLTGSEPEFSYTTAASTAQHTISILTGTTATDGNLTFVAVAYMTKTKECWVAKSTTAGVTFGYVTPTSPATTVPSTACTTANGATAGKVTSGTHGAWPIGPSGH